MECREGIDMSTKTSTHRFKTSIKTEKGHVAGDWAKLGGCSCLGSTLLSVAGHVQLKHDRRNFKRYPAHVQPVDGRRETQADRLKCSQPVSQKSEAA